jgi:lipopolysaccharide export system protein LptA
VVKIFFSIVLILCLCFPLHPLRGESVVPEGEPVHVTSDRLDVYNSKHLAIFSGKVKVIQKDSVITSDELYVFYKNQEANTDQPTGDTEAMRAGNIERLEARGTVRIVQGDRVITGEQAVFFNKEEKIVVTGNAVMQEGNNIIKGGTITFFTKEQKGIVEKADEGRVSATIYPQENTKQ